MGCQASTVGEEGGEEEEGVETEARGRYRSIPAKRRRRRRRKRRSRTTIEATKHRWGVWD